MCEFVCVYECVYANVYVYVCVCARICMCFMSVRETHVGTYVWALIMKA